jgi:hypothetical protein
VAKLRFQRGESALMRTFEVCAVLPGAYATCMVMT